MCYTLAMIFHIRESDQSSHSVFNSRISNAARGFCLKKRYTPLNTLHISVQRPKTLLQPDLKAETTLAPYTSLWHGVSSKETVKKPYFYKSK